MSELQLLLAGLCENPFDDFARLAYADRLEEMDDSYFTRRADFIRVQCRRWEMDPYHLSCTSQKCGNQECNDLRQQERELLGEYGLTWLSELLPGQEKYSYWLVNRQAATGGTIVGTSTYDPQLVNPGVTPMILAILGKNKVVTNMPNPNWQRTDYNWRTFQTKFQRGFVSEMEANCKSWLEWGPELVKSTPLCQLSLTGMVREMEVTTLADRARHFSYDITYPSDWSPVSSNDHHPVDFNSHESPGHTYLAIWASNSKSRDELVSQIETNALIWARKQADLPDLEILISRSNRQDQVEEIT